MTTSTPANSDESSPSNIWRPRNGTTWQCVLQDQIKLDKTIEDFDVWVIDLFDNSAADVTTLHERGRRVIGYFSAGTYEEWRSDAIAFKSSDLGKPLDNWPGERFVNINSTGVRDIMLKRLDMAASKGFDGVDPDNIDGYDNDNGLGLTEADAVNFALFLANAAHAQGLSIGLKNAGGLVSKVVDQMQWSVQEQCIQYGEEELYQPFIKQGKPVFNVEYPKGEDSSSRSMNNEKNVKNAQKQKISDAARANGFSTIIKNVNLDQWVEKC